MTNRHAAKAIPRKPRISDIRALIATLAEDGVDIRRATIADLDALACLFDGYRQFYKQPADLEGARRFLAGRFHRQQSVIFLARIDGKDAGFAQLYPSFSSVSMARTFILNDLFVAPDARGMGVGKALLHQARDYAARIGAVRLSLSTNIDNKAAQALYEQQGWVRDRQFLSYHLAMPVGLPVSM